MACGGVYNHLCVCVCGDVDNILLQHVGGGAGVSSSVVYDGSMDEGLGDESVDELDHVVYKIGDLGQVAAVMSHSVDEGIYISTVVCCESACHWLATATQQLHTDD